MTITTPADWAIWHGYTDVETDTSEEFIAWQESGTMRRERYSDGFTLECYGVKAWRDDYRDCYVAILLYQNGERRGEARGYGDTMLAALQDL